MNADLYQLLGVARDAWPQEIKRAYRREAKRAHPDKGGSAKLMAELAHAYEVLSDPERRKVYDETGSDGSAQPGSELVQEAAELLAEVAGNADHGTSAPAMLGLAEIAARLQAKACRSKALELSTASGKVRGLAKLLSGRDEAALVPALMLRRADMMEDAAEEERRRAELCDQLQELLRSMDAKGGKLLPGPAYGVPKSMQETLEELMRAANIPRW